MVILTEQIEILDNRYLYEILTEGKYPERIPLDKLLAESET